MFKNTIYYQPIEAPQHDKKLIKNKKIQATRPTHLISAIEPSIHII